MDIKNYFNPLIPEELDFYSSEHSSNLLGDSIMIYQDKSPFPDLENASIVIIGVPEEKNAYNNLGCSEAPNEVRKQLYQLYKHPNMPIIVDLGNLKIGKTANDTYVALSDILAELIQAGLTIVIIGGSQDITYANYCAYEQLNQIINIVSIDSKFDIGNEEHAFNSKSYLHKIILKQPNFLFNYSNLGYQTYLVDNINE